MSMQCLTQLYTVQGLFRDGDGDGLPDGLNVRFSAGRAPGAIDVAARLGLESAALTPGFTGPAAEGIPVWFGPENPECPAPPVPVPAGAGAVALAAGGLLVTGATPAAGRDAARWLAETFPFAAPGGPLLSELAGGRPVKAVIIKHGAVADLVTGDGTLATAVDKRTVEGAPPAPPFLPEPVGDLPPEGPARLFTVDGLMGSTDSIRHDRAGWQVVLSADATPEEVAALCELAARTGVEAVGLGFPFAVDAYARVAGRPAISLADSAPEGAAWVEGHLAWAPAHGLTAFGTPAERAAALRAAAGAGLVDGLHATLFTSRAALPEARGERSEPVFDLALEQEWEVERFRRAWRGVLPAIAAGQPVSVDLRLSEPLTVRDALADEMARDLVAAGVPEARIRVLSAYKQGFHWLEEEMLPRLQALGAGALGRVHVACARFAAGAEALEMPIRWLQELYPADELLSAALGVPVAFDLAEAPQTEIYRLTAFGPDGAEVLTESFSPVSSARHYLPEFPHRGMVHPPTGMLRVEQGARLLLETAIDTDAEAFWTAWQEQVLPRLRAYVVETFGPAPDAGAQPFFGALVVEAALSEDDRRLGIREEQISPLDAMHEDLYFYTLDYLNELGVQLTGKGYPAPGAVEPWVVQGEGGGPRARVRLYARPDTAPPPAASALPATAGDLPEPAPDIPLHVLIGPDQLPPYLAYLSALPGVRVWRTGLSYAGRPTWALTVTAPTAGAIAPPQKLSAWRPTLLVNARHHANEVSSTNSILKLAEWAARNGTAAQVNLVLSPLENVDGAAIHYAMQEVHPHWKLHAARFNAAGMEFAADAFTRAPRFGEARTVPTLWRSFQPDVFLDDHGYPSHEWVQPFSGYNSPPYFRTSWWVPNALIYGIHRWMDAERFPANGAVQEGLRDAMAARLTAHAEIQGYTEQLLERYETYGRRHVPEKFPLEQYRGFIALVGSPVPAGPDARTYVGRFPHITAAELVTEVPDETAQGEYLALCARAHLEGDFAVLDYLKERPQAVLRRRWTDGTNTWWMAGRDRPLQA